MARAPSTIQRTPGPKTPGKYSFTGPNYQMFGEQPGYIYYPWNDQYYIDPKATQSYAEQQGLAKKPPGLAETILPVAGVLGAGYAATELGKQGGQALGGLFSGGSTASSTGAATTATAPTVATGTAGGAAASGGMLPATTGAASSVAPAATEAGAAGTAAGTSGGMFSASGIGSAGNAILPVAGAGLAYDVVANQRTGARGIGEGAAAGAAIGSYAGPWGALIGAGAGALYGIGQTLVLSSDKDMWKTEKNRLEKLSENGAFIPPQLLAAMPTKGRSKEELIRGDLPSDFIGRDSNGNWVNNKFAKSRNVADLRGEDIVNYSAFAEKDPQWFTKPLDQRIAYSNQLLQAGVVKEHHGTIDIDWSKAPPSEVVSAAAGTPGPVPKLPTSGGMMPPSRSKTRSPGISNTGQRISYGR